MLAAAAAFRLSAAAAAAAAEATGRSNSGGGGGGGGGGVVATNTCARCGITFRLLHICSFLMILLYEIGRDSKNFLEDCSPPPRRLLRNFNYVK